MTKLLVILPHCDDELGILPYLFREAKISTEIMFVYLSHNKERRAESTKFVSMLNYKMGFNVKVAFVHPSLTDGQMFRHVPRLKNVLLSLSNEYDKVFCPLGEGGHQDHDIVFLCSLQIFAKKLLCFCLYREHPQLYFMGFSKDPIYSSKNIKVRFFFSEFLFMCRSIFYFRSQILVLFLLSPYIFKSYLSGVAYFSDFDDIEGVVQRFCKVKKLYFKRGVVSSDRFMKYFKKNFQ